MLDRLSENSQREQVFFKWNEVASNESKCRGGANPSTSGGTIHQLIQKQRAVLFLFLKKGLANVCMPSVCYVQARAAQRARLATRAQDITGPKLQGVLSRLKI